MRTSAKQVADNALGKALNTEIDVAKIKGLTYTFSVENGKTVGSTTNGQAGQWSLNKNDSLTFGATDDLSVSTDGKGNVIYGLSESSKKSHL